MSAKEMIINCNCKYQETSWGIWIDTETGSSDENRFCMIDKREKKIIFQDDEKQHKLDLNLFHAIYKLCFEELGWESDK